jgi:signal transduction histidine kinase
MYKGPLPGGRRFLLAGFGGLLLLMLLAGADALLVLRQVRTSNIQVREAYLRRDHSLEQIRGGIYQSAIIIRDYLLAANAADAREQAEKWDAIRRNTEQALDETAAVLDSSESSLFDDLRMGVRDYWKLRDSVVRPEGSDKPNRSSLEELARRRTALLSLIDRIDELSTLELAASEPAKLGLAFNRLRLQLTVMLAVTLGAGLLLAAFTVWRTLRLETELQKRYQEGAEARRELTDLSARLVSAQEEERRVISRELHDEVGQSLSALLVEAGNAAASVPRDSAEVRRHVESIKKLAEASVEVIRNMSLLLRPSMLDDFGLVPALEWQAREVSKRTGLRVHVAAEESADQLPDEHKTCIYRVVQEALHNCARHSHARSVRVQVRQEPLKIVLSVEDDGRGFDARRVRGLGLVGMQERVHHLGGAFQVESRPGGGTVVAVELPLAG